MSEFKGMHADLWPGYRVSEDGHVFSVASNWRGYGERELNQSLNADGYPSVRINRDGKRVHLAVHRMVAATYLPPRPSSRHEVRHLDGDKTHNHRDNLAWGTRKENADDRERHGRTSRGTAHSLATRIAISKSTNPFFRHARPRAWKVYVV